MAAPTTLQALRIFITGRVAWVVFGLLFQLATVRVLPLEEYVVFVTVAAIVLLVQWGLSFSIPRIVSRVGATYAGPGDTVGLSALLRRLALIRLAIALVAIVVVGAAVAIWADALPGTASPALVGAATAWALSLTIFADAEAAGQLLMQQRLARLVVGLEPAIRTGALVLMAAFLADVTALQVIALSAVTTSAAALALAGGVVGWHRRGPALARTTAPPPVLPSARQLARLSLAAQASAIGSLFVSPGAVRLVAAAHLPVEAYAAFSFIQGLVVSAIRFTPSLMMTSAIEPLIMTNLERTGSPRLLEAALGFLFKVELVFWAPLITGLIAAGPIVITVLSGGQFASYDLLLPALLPLLILYGLYRSFETAALALGAVGRLNLTLVAGAVGLAVLMATAPLAGIAAIVMVPHLEALLRLGIVGLGLARLGVTRIFDPVALAIAATATCGLGFGARALLAGQPGGIAIAGAAVAAIAALAIILATRPLRRAEADILPAHSVVGRVGRRFSRA